MWNLHSVDIQSECVLHALDILSESLLNGTFVLLIGVLVLKWWVLILKILNRIIIVERKLSLWLGLFFFLVCMFHPSGIYSIVWLEIWSVDSLVKLSLERMELWSVNFYLCFPQKSRSGCGNVVAAWRSSRALELVTFSVKDIRTVSPAVAATSSPVTPDERPKFGWTLTNSIITTPSRWPKTFPLESELLGWNITITWHGRIFSFFGRQPFQPKNPSSRNELQKSEICENELWSDPWRNQSALRSLWKIVIHYFDLICFGVFVCAVLLATILDISSWKFWE